MSRFKNRDSATLGILLATALAIAACVGVDLTAPPGSSITLIANPTFVSAHGGRSLITAILTEPAGTPVPDGTTVYFFTDLGTIEREVKTRGGLAQTFFVSDSRSGEATITAVSGGVAATTTSSSPGASPAPTTTSSGSNSSTVKIRVGNINVEEIRVRAEPPRITDSRSTHVFALVFDGSGNPVANVPVIFEVTSDRATEFFDSAGQPRFTDNNGQAEDVLRTRRARGSGGTAVVCATVPGASSGGSTTPASPSTATPGCTSIFIE